jgi:hypothetical protein
MPKWQVTDFFGNEMTSWGGNRAGVDCNGGFNYVDGGITKLPDRLVITGSDDHGDGTDAICIARLAWIFSSNGGASDDTYSNFILGDMLRDAGFPWGNTDVSMAVTSPNGQKTDYTVQSCFWLSSRPQDHPDFINSIVIWDLRQFQQATKNGMVTAQTLPNYLGVVTNNNLCVPWSPPQVEYNNCATFPDYGGEYKSCSFCREESIDKTCDILCS